MLIKRKMIPVVISALSMTVFSTAAISATNTLLSGPHQAAKTDSMLAYADKTEAVEDSPHGSHGSQESHEDAKSDKKRHKHPKMSDVDLDGDGKISKDEFFKHHEAMFDKKDLNNDGFIDEDEMRKMMKKKHGHGHGY
ncbi:MAG: hypothetical protein NMNS01_24020 [Nitrosomonas sp.]|nr:MAG: hypothetical protein NMNS01_24020 [Nitrosomonas sp.]